MIDFEVRKSVFSAINNIVVDSNVIPVFDSYVNPNVAIPNIRNADCYILIQDQQNQLAGIQNMCNERISHNITIRVVTKYATENVVSGKLRDDIAKEVMIAMRLATSSNLNIQKVEFPITQNIDEFANGQTALTKILIYQIYLNQ